MKKVRQTLEVVALLLVCSVSFADNAYPVSEGVADLRSWDHRAPVRLSGDYEFYWNQHLQSRQLLMDPDLKPGFLKVPGTWNDFTVNDREVQGNGFATYRVNLLVSSIEPYSLKLPDIGTSYELFIDGVSRLRIGEPGASRSSTTPKYYPTTVEFTPSSHRVELIFHVSNFHYRMGGIWLPIIFGTPDQIESLTDNQRALDLMLFGAILIIGLYNLALFALRREDPSSLYLGLFCLLLATRLMAVGERFLTRITDLPFEWYVRIEFLSWILAISAFAAFLRTMLPNEFHKNNCLSIHGLVAIGSVIVLLTPVYTFTHVVTPFQILTIICMIAGSIAFAMAIFHGREGALILTLAYAVLFYSVVNDILINAGVIDSILLLDLGLVVFIFFQSTLISYRFTRSFKMIENQRISLQAINLRLRTQEKLRQQAEDESEQLQRKIAASEKMEIIEALVAGMRDRIENFLATNSDSPPGKVIKDFLIIADSDFATRQSLNLNAIITEVMQGSSVINGGLQADLPNIRCADSHARRLVSGLMEYFKAQSKADLFIETHFEKSQERSLFFNDLNEGDYVVFTIGGSSNAPIKHQELENLFDPRKTIERHDLYSTGLGLSVVWHVVNKLNGGIELVFLEKGGVRFEIYLPAEPA